MCDLVGIYLFMEVNQILTEQEEEELAREWEAKRKEELCASSQPAPEPQQQLSNKQETVPIEHWCSIL